MTRCPEEGLLAGFICRDVSSGEAALVESHLAECTHCAEWVVEAGIDECLLREMKSALSGGTQVRLANTPAFATAFPEIPGYQINAEIHRGGQGVVYRARQVSTRREVAIKLLLAGHLASAEARRRFELEIELAAQLHHPNIVTIFDAGTTVDGLLYCVMDYIAGQRIDRYCDERELTVAERLKLFRQVCAAVQFAHTHLVVHRDLKPANILVTSAGVPKLLDFGIAKLLHPDSEGLTQTAADGRPMTPCYASPEQMRGQRITTAADVYSLGVVLYELLTGHRPYRIRTRVHQDMLRVVCEEVPLRPSEMVGRVATEEYVDPESGSAETRIVTPENVSRTREGEPRALRKRLTGDVDNLVLYALRKEPERRYQSAQQLCDDIQAHLDDRPLPIARPESRTYHVRKTLRRYRFALAAVAAIVVALSAGLGTALHLYGKAQIARQEAEAARVRADERARETMQLAKLPSQILRAIDTDAIESQLMDGLRERTHTALKGQYIGDWRTRRKRTAQEIEVDLASYDERSRSIQRWDIVQKAMGEHVVRAAAEAIRGFETQPLVQAEMQYAVGTGYLNAETAMFAEPHVRIALQIRERELGTDHVDTLNTLSAMGTVLSMQGKMVEAEDCHRRELFGRQRVQGVSHPDTLSARYELARVLSWEGKLSEAEVYFRAALHGYRRVLGDDHEKSLNCMNYMGIVLQRQGKLEEAEAFYRERLERNLRMCDICPTTLASIESLGRLLVEQHQLAEAENLFREALGKYGWVMRGGAGGQNLLQPTLDLVTCLGGLLNESGRYSEAVATLIDAEAVFRRTNHAFPGQRDLGQYLIELGKAHHGDENYGDAEAALLEAYDLLSSFECPLGSPRCQPGLDNTKERCVAALVELYEDWNAVEPEAGYAQKAVDWCEKGSAPRVHARIPFER